MAKRNTRIPKSKRASIGDVWRVLQLAPTDDAALAELKRLNPSRSIVRRALGALRDIGRTNGALTQYADEKGWTLGQASRRPRVNERRRYAVMQQTNGGGPFIRLPVEPIGLAVGDHVWAGFMVGRIVVDPDPGPRA